MAVDPIDTGSTQSGAGMDGADQLSRATVHDLLGHLATIKGNAQLIRRRMVGDGSAEQNRTLASLAAMELAINELVVKLNALRQREAMSDPGSEPDR